MPILAVPIIASILLQTDPIDSGWLKLGGMALFAYFALAIVKMAFEFSATRRNGNGKTLGNMSPEVRDSRISAILQSGHDAQDERLAGIVSRAISELTPAMGQLATAVENSNRMLTRAEDMHIKSLNGIAILLDRSNKIDSKSAGAGR